MKMIMKMDMMTGHPLHHILMMVMATMTGMSQGTI